VNTTSSPVHDGAPEILSLQPIANRCSSGSCPTIYLTATGSVVVQGYTVPPDHTGLDVADGETLVEIPLELLADALKNLS
jgi:hypothetical protein